MNFDKGILASNLAQIQERVARAAGRSGRRANEITLIAVSKTFPAEAIREAHALGVGHFGENRVQEWDAKRSELDGLDATVHLIGHLQSNKARRAAQIFGAIDSVDSIALARKLDAAFAECARSGTDRLPILLEVQLAAEESKSGIKPAELPTLIDAIVELPRVELRGLMAIPPYLGNPEDVRPYFRQLRELHEAAKAHLDAKLRGAFREMSMGMSHDFEVAIEEGATQVRLGTALFGSRSTQ
ncbi:MAG TPA: YggS family pyridoxal phosphate-dependent enzyme [Candidatus Acidoferrales bacterium]|nr:YggS family pyridoxal phosphate-dependent enzyme [Candidatus Acidoferrales bacterium]